MVALNQWGMFMCLRWDSKQRTIYFIGKHYNKYIREATLTLPRGLFTNYVMRFSPFFDHPPTYGYVLASILLIIYLIKVCDSYILLTTHPPQRHNVICERPHSR